MCFGSWNKINPFITKYSQSQQFWNTLITVSEIPCPYYDLWNNKVDIVILSFNNEWVILVHWWQWQAAVEGSLWGDERAPDVPPAKPLCTAHRSCSAFWGRTVAALIWRLKWSQMLSVMFSRDEYFVYIFLSIQIFLFVDKVHIAVVGDASYTVTDTRPTTNVGMRCSPN